MDRLSRMVKGWGFGSRVSMHEARDDDTLRVECSFDRVHTHSSSQTAEHHPNNPTKTSHSTSLPKDTVFSSITLKKSTSRSGEKSVPKSDSRSKVKSWSIILLEEGV